MDIHPIYIVDDNKANYGATPEFLKRWRLSGTPTRLMLIREFAAEQCSPLLYSVLDQRTIAQASAVVDSIVKDLERHGMPFDIPEWSITIAKARAFAFRDGISFQFIPVWGPGTVKRGWQLDEHIVPLGFYKDRGVLDVELYWNMALNRAEALEIQPPNRRFVADQMPRNWYLTASTTASLLGLYIHGE